MKVDISEIISNENKEMTKEVELSLASYNAGIGEFSIEEKAPFTLFIANEGNKRLIIKGETEVAIAIPCDRCLEEVVVNFALDISKEIDLAKFLAKDIEEMEEANYMIGTELDVDKLIFGEILVSWPVKVLCREDCEGICKRCGANLNQTICQCQKTEPDPRMAAIQDIFNQFKEV